MLSWQWVGEHLHYWLSIGDFIIKEANGFSFRIIEFSKHAEVCLYFCLPFPWPHILWLYLIKCASPLIIIGIYISPIALISFIDLILDFLFISPLYTASNFQVNAHMIEVSYAALLSLYWCSPFRNIYRASVLIFHISLAPVVNEEILMYWANTFLLHFYWPMKSFPFFITLVFPLHLLILHSFFSNPWPKLDSFSIELL